MRKHICTTTVFLALVGVIIVALLVPVPDKVWWLRNYSGLSNGVPLVLWAFGNIVLPLMALGSAFLVGRCLWDVSDLICSKLRRGARFWMTRGMRYYCRSKGPPSNDSL